MLEDVVFARNVWREQVSFDAPRSALQQDLKPRCQQKERLRWKEMRVRATFEAVKFARKVQREHVSFDAP